MDSNGDGIEPDAGVILDGLGKGMAVGAIAFDPEDFWEEFFGFIESEDCQSIFGRPYRADKHGPSRRLVLH